MNNQSIIIRVYAVIINEEKEVLLSDEYMMDMRMTKFPGGGMKPGEGPVECLKREAREEFGQEIQILEHYYTTDYYQPARFFKNSQLISIYYRAEFIDKIRFHVSKIPFDYGEEKNGAISFRWKKIMELKEIDVTFPIDRKVVRLLTNEYRG
jgi:8-oxo-dGTP pyrophosphatase MutT (NUDIX family)